MNRLLQALGLMRVSEHEAATRSLRKSLFESEQKRIHWQGQSNEMAAKFKKAITDLAAARGEVDGLQKLANGLDGEIQKCAHDRDAWQKTATTYASELADIRPDAEAMRRKRQMDRDRRKGGDPLHLGKMTRKRDTHRMAETACPAPFMGGPVGAADLPERNDP